MSACRCTSSSVLVRRVSALGPLRPDITPENSHNSDSCGNPEKINKNKK